jgi:tRNA nucleotidyltransferase (CCA-adding enzyme)
VSEAPPILRSLGDEALLRTIREIFDGREVHLVGGAIRDRFLGIESPDFDLVVSGDGEAAAAKLASRIDARLVLLGGERFAAFRLVHSDFTIDLWDRQQNSLFSDLERRDFTINALALNLQDGTLQDPFSGLGDLKRHTLRAVTDRSFTGDPLRILRLVRFALLLPDFSIEPLTAELARSAAPDISAVASERVRDELALVLGLGQPTRALELLIGVDLLPRLWGQEQTGARKINRLLKTVGAWEEAEADCLSVVGTKPDRLLSVHALINRKLGTGAMDEDLRPSTLLSRTRRRVVARLSQIDPFALSRDPRRFLASWGELWLEAAGVSRALHEDPELKIGTLLEPLRDLVEAEGESVLDPQPLLDGQEIQELLGLSPGPQVGRLLEKLLDAQLGGAVSNRRQAADFLIADSNRRRLTR